MALGSFLSAVVLEVKASWKCRWWGPSVRLWTPVLRIPGKNEAPGGGVGLSVYLFCVGFPSAGPMHLVPLSESPPPR